MASIIIPVATAIAVAFALYIFWKAKKNTRQDEAPTRNKVQFYITCTECKRHTHQSAITNGLCPECAVNIDAIAA